MEYIRLKVGRRMKGYREARGAGEKGIVCCTVGKRLLALELVDALAITFFRIQWRAYRGSDGAIVGGGSLGGEVDTVGGLELDLKGSCGRVSGRAGGSIGVADLRQCGRSPC